MRSASGPMFDLITFVKASPAFSKSARRVLVSFTTRISTGYFETFIIAGDSKIRLCNRGLEDPRTQESYVADKRIVVHFTSDSYSLSKNRFKIPKCREHHIPPDDVVRKRRQYLTSHLPLRNRSILMMKISPCNQG